VIDLLLPPITAALVILSIHAYLGLHVLVREIIFVDLAFAQIAALGATIGLVAGLHAGSTPVYALSFGFTLLGAVLFTFTRVEHPRVPQEAIIGITFVVASAAVLLVASATAEGAEHVSETLTGTLLWIRWPEVARLAVAFGLLGAFHYVFRRPILTVSFEPRTLRHPRLWDLAFYVTFGLVITFSVAVAGVLLVFSMLVIPAAVAYLFVHRTGPALLLAWLSGGIAILLGVSTSFVWDLTTGPTLVCAFGAVLIVASLLRLVLPHRMPAKGQQDLVEAETPAKPLSTTRDY
jgi:zinc/manganese transport system permease protein